MATIFELSLLAQAIYEVPPGGVEGWTAGHCQAAGGGLWNGLQAGVFTRGRETVIAFRGTVPSSAADLTADVKLGAGMNTTHFAAAEDFAARHSKDAKDVVVCGHSLGGAIAQVVANRGGFRFATFNAPGVALFASRNIWQAEPSALALRTAGALLSAVRHPQQAYRDVVSTFNRVVGLNVCLEGDLVSRWGVHYGEVVRIPGTDQNPATQHKIATVVSVLAQNHRVGALAIESFT